jgi:Holliday junction DNA helicase RuvA
LMPERAEGDTPPATADVVDGQVLEDAYKALLSVGHTPADARDRLDKALVGGKRYKTVDELLLAIYNRTGG